MICSFVRLLADDVCNCGDAISKETEIKRAGVRDCNGRIHNQ